MADIIDVNIGDQVLEVFWQDEVELNLDMNLMYIKSGQKEIQDYVDNVSKPEIDNYIETEAKPIVTKVVNTIAEPLVNEYIEGTVKPDIDTYTNEKLEAFNTNAASLTTAYTTNAATLVAEYNANAAEKTDAFNTNASEKQAMVDASVAAATAQAGIATEQATAAANSATAASNSASNASADANNASESAGLAANSAAAAATSEANANTSETNALIWAEGTDAQVQALGGEKSAKGWAKASTAVNYTNITNCITEIPQDIKLELKDGTLTLKAGSKVYVPNGFESDGVTKKFDEVTVQNDVTLNTSATGTFFCYIKGNNFQIRRLDFSTSGTTQPTSGTWLGFYNTSTNYMLLSGKSTTFESGFSLPFAIITISSGTTTSIDQVFNGFGYIGSTVFALPGVKGLIPNGRNEDGSLKNTEFTISQVKTKTLSSSSSGNYKIVSNQTGVYYNNTTIYDEITNTNSTARHSAESGTSSVSNGVITSFNPKTAFHAVDWNDYIREINKKGGGLEIGDIGFAPLGIDEAQNKRRYLNGQVISQTQFVSFTNKIKSAIELNPSLATTETNWQAEVTNSPYGICGKFVIDDTLGTIRLPKYPDWSIREVGQAPVVGNGMTLGVTDGANNFGISWQSNQPRLDASTGSYGGKVGQTVSNYGSTATANTNIGVTTDPTKSGIIANLTNANTEDKLQGNWFIQVATGVEESVDVTREIELNNPFSLLDYKWSEYEITNASWLLSNGAFHSGATYVAVYELLLKIKNGTETKDGVSVKLSTEAYTDTDFVINTADTTFRLPVKVKLASGNAVVGNGMTLGITDGHTNAGFYATTGAGLETREATYNTSVGTTSSNSAGLGNYYSIGITTDPTKSGIETSSSGLKLYFYVGETIQDANVIAASKVLTKVANGIDRTVATDRETVVGWGMPDYSAGITISALPYTAQANGFIFVTAIRKSNTSASGYISINGVNYIRFENVKGYSVGSSTLQVYINKGDVIDLAENADFIQGYFVPLKGVLK